MTEMEPRSRSQGKQLDVVARKLNHTVESDSDGLKTEYVVSRGKSGKFLHRMTSSDADDEENENDEEQTDENERRKIYYNHFEDDDDDEEEEEEDDEDDEEDENNQQNNNQWKEKVAEMENMDDENKKEYLREIISKYKTETKTELLLKMIDFLGTSLFHVPECDTARDTLLIHGAFLNSRITELLCNPTQLLPVRHHSNISYRSNLLRPANQSIGKSSLQTIEYMRKSNEQQKIDRITKNVLKKKSIEESNRNGEDSENSFEEVVDLANKEDELDAGQEEEEDGDDEEEVDDVLDMNEEAEDDEELVDITGEEVKLQENEEDDEDDDEEDDFQYADLMNTENVLTTGVSNQGQPLEVINSVTDLTSLGVVDNKDYFGASDLPSEGVNNAFMNDFSVVTTEEEMFAGIEKLDDIMDQQAVRDEDGKVISDALIEEDMMDKKRRIYEENENEKKRRIN